jgi:hypothetical protein
MKDIQYTTGGDNQMQRGAAKGKGTTFLVVW